MVGSKRKPDKRKRKGQKEKLNKNNELEITKRNNKKIPRKRNQKNISKFSMLNLFPHDCFLNTKNH